MARPLRANFKNGCYHVTARSNNRQRILLDERDRRHFLELLARARRREGYRKLAEEKVGGLEESRWSQVRWGLVRGKRFARKVWETLEAGRESSGRRAARARRSWAEVVRAVEQARGEKWAEFAPRRGDSRLALTLYVARRCTGMTLRALGEAAGWTTMLWAWSSSGWNDVWQAITPCAGRRNGFCMNARES